MRKGTKIGWLLIALSIMLSVWVITSESTVADTKEDALVEVWDGSSDTGEDDSGVEVWDGNAAKSKKKAKKDEDFVVAGSTVKEYTGEGGQVALPDGITAIGSDAFAGKEVSAVANDDNVKSIEAGAFSGSKMTNYSLPASLSDLSQEAFRGSETLSGFSGGSPTYTVRGGCVYKDNGKTLYIVPEGKNGSVEIPDGVESIAPGALEGAGKVSTLYIPGSVKKISGLSNSSVSTIYGYAGSRAEESAAKNGIQFVAIGGNSQDALNVPESSTAIFEAADGTKTAVTNVVAATYYGADDENEREDAYNDIDYEVPDDANNQQAPATEPAPAPAVPQTQAAPVNGSGGYAGGQVAHTPDQTPKTADGDIDPRYLLCLSIFLGGVAVLCFSRLWRLTYVASHHMVDRDELD